MFIQDSTAGIWVHVPPGGPTAITRGHVAMEDGDEHVGV
jgi:hypothetical protein